MPTPQHTPTHTPGPWSIRFEFNVFGNGRIVAGCGGYASNTKSEEIHAENVANARLIAAAPALVAALQRLMAQPLLVSLLDSIENAPEGITTDDEDKEFAAAFAEATAALRSATATE